MRLPNAPRTLATGSLVLLLGSAATASAAGINIFWNDCGQGTSRTTHRTFACNTNSAAHNFYVSFEPAQPLPQMIDNTNYVSVQSAAPNLGNWWQFINTGSCRQTALIVNTTLAGSCIDPWLGQASEAIEAYEVTANTPGMPPNRARIIAVAAVPAVSSANVEPGIEYFSMLLSINSAKTVGAGACGGCTDPVCIVLDEIFITQQPGAPGGDVHMTTPLLSNFITWQGGGPNCPGATPALNRTWGQVKSIYR